MIVSKRTWITVYSEYKNIKNFYYFHKKYDQVSYIHNIETPYKNSKKTRTISYVVQTFCSNLYVCEHCGFMSGKHKVKEYMFDFWRIVSSRKEFREDTAFDKWNVTLCKSCWSKYSDIYKKIKQCNDNKRLINKIKQEITNERKNRNYRSAEILSC